MHGSIHLLRFVNKGKVQRVYACVQFKSWKMFQNLSCQIYIKGKKAFGKKEEEEKQEKKNLIYARWLVQSFGLTSLWFESIQSQEEILAISQGGNLKMKKIEEKDSLDS